MLMSLILVCLIWNMPLNFHWEEELCNLGNQNGGKLYLRIFTQEFLCEIMQIGVIMNACVFALNLAIRL